MKWRKLLEGEGYALWDLIFNFEAMDATYILWF